MGGKDIKKICFQRFPDVPFYVFEKFTGLSLVFFPSLWYIKRSASGIALDCVHNEKEGLSLNLNDNTDNNRKKPGPGSGDNRNMLGIASIILWSLVIILGINYVSSRMDAATTTEIQYSELLEMIANDQVESVVIYSGKIEITQRVTPSDQDTDSQEQDDSSIIPGLENLDSVLSGETDGMGEPVASLYCAPLYDPRIYDLMDEHGVTYGTPYVEELSPIINILVTWVLPMVFMVLLLSFVFRSMSSKLGGGLGGVGKANAKVYVEKSTGVTFQDVAGQDEAKESMEEIIDILHDPEKYTQIGAKLPKGALLVGSPGTGKTLLAKAVAGEANVPFFSISGSDFVEMFVGVGASRVRDLFKEASKMAPCIIFIDEIDTIGKSRDNRMGGNDEREQTLNQLLAELDGFDPTKGVIVLAATNRPEVLDKALLRPGRFDRRVTVDRPNLAGRLTTLQVHTRTIRLGEDVDLNKLAQATAGPVGADLANLVNEAALRAVRHGRMAVCQQDLLLAFETVLAGAEKKGTVLTEKEKKLIAYHEVGHALVAAKQKDSEPVSKITIVPHTQGALGYTLQLPEEEKFLMTKEDLLVEIRTLLGGRCAEELEFATMTTGASNDIERATETARKMVTMYGMSDRFGVMGLATVRNQYLEGGYGLSCAEQTAALIDEEVKTILDGCYKEALTLLEENREMLDAISAYLFQKETITGGEMMAILAGEDPEKVDDHFTVSSPPPVLDALIPSPEETEETVDSQEESPLDEGGEPSSEPPLLREPESSSPPSDSLGVPLDTPNVEKTVDNVDNFPPSSEEDPK